MTTFDALLREPYPDAGPGVALLVARHGETVAVSCSGLADVDAGLPVTPDTVFDLASASKHMTARAVLLLASRGLLEPGDDVRDYLDELALYGEPGHRPVRIFDLVHHTSGLPDYCSCLDPCDYAGFSNDALASWAARQTPDFAPGSRGYLAPDGLTYCNTNYALLANIVERVSGVPFGEFMRLEFFGPLGMADTCCHLAGDTLARRARRYGRDGLCMAAPREIPVWGDGCAYSTLSDLARWERELNRPTILDADWAARAWVPGELDDGSPTDYAWGWKIEVGEHRYAHHGGSWDGTSACISRRLDDGVSVYVLSCSQHVAACATAWKVDAVV